MSTRPKEDRDIVHGVALRGTDDASNVLDLSATAPVPLAQVTITLSAPPHEEPPELDKPYRFITSYVGVPNVYDSFKKVDHKFRADAHGPLEEVPVVLACTAFENRDASEVEAVTKAFIDTVAWMLSGELTAGDETCRVRRLRCEVAVDPPTWTGRVRLTLSDAQPLALYTAEDAGTKLDSGYEFEFSGAAKRFHVIVENNARVELKAELVGAAASDTVELASRAEQPESMRAAWLAFKDHYQPSADAAALRRAFMEAAWGRQADILRLARIGSLYWYSDTGDVLMNAYLRSGATLGEKLKERREYLVVYYKDDHTQIGKLPPASDIDRDAGRYGEQIKAQADMLRETLDSDFLKAPPAETKLYRGMAFKHDQSPSPDAIFAVGKQATLRGFSSSAVEPSVAYRFMKDSASDLNVLTKGEADDFPEEKSAHPIFYRISGGAEQGRLLGAYSLHHGESEVLFNDGIYPTVIGRAQIVTRVVERRLGPKFVKRTNTAVFDCDDEQRGDVEGDAGFKHAKAALGQDMSTAELRTNPLTAGAYKKAVQEQGASLGLEWPHGPGILLVTARMG